MHTCLACTRPPPVRASTPREDPGHSSRVKGHLTTSLTQCRCVPPLTREPLWRLRAALGAGGGLPSYHAACCGVLTLEATDLMRFIRLLAEAAGVLREFEHSAFYPLL
jgi:hypothetical protein